MSATNASTIEKIQDNSYEAIFITPDFSDLRISTRQREYIPAIWHIEADDEEQILEGDFVRYYDEDKKRYSFGRFVNLWEWSHPGETSPDYGDIRTMAYIMTVNANGSRRGVYADVTTITLAS